MLKKKKVVMLVIFIIIAIFHTKVQANTVENRGEADGLIATPNDFFLELGELLPGDSKEDIAYIKNSTNSQIEVFFKTEPLEKNEYYDDIDYSLLEKIKLKISLKKNKNAKEELLYNGNLGAELMKEYISLGEYKKGYDGEFIFKIEVPTDLRNDYTLSTTKVKWVFAVEKKDKKSEESIVQNIEENKEENITENSKDQNLGNSISDSENEEKSLVNNVIESIYSGDKIYFMITILVLSIVIVIIVIKRRDTYEE